MYSKIELASKVESFLFMYLQTLRFFYSFILYIFFLFLLFYLREHKHTRYDNETNNVSYDSWQPVSCDANFCALSIAKWLFRIFECDD